MDSSNKCTDCGETIVAQVDGKFYTDLAAAWSAATAKEGENTLLTVGSSKIVCAEELIVPNGVDLHLAAYNKTWARVQIQAAITVAKGGILTLDDTTTLNSFDDTKPVLTVNGTLNAGGNPDIQHYFATSDERQHIGYCALEIGAGAKADLRYCAIDGVKVTSGTLNGLANDLAAEGYYCKVLIDNSGNTRMLTEAELANQAFADRIRVVPIPVKITQQPTAATTTYGTSASLSVTASPTGDDTNISYQWFRVKEGTETTNVAVDSGTSSTLTPPAGLNAGPHKFYCAVTCDGYTLNSNEATVTVTPKELTITGAALDAKTYDGNTTAAVKGVTFGGLVNGDSLSLGNDYTAEAVFDSADAGTGKTVTVTVTLDGLVKNYTLTQNTCKLENQTIAKAEQTLSVPASTYEKTYGDGAFSLGCSIDGAGDGTISYASGNEDVLQVAADGTATIKKAGEATVTVSLSEGTNYKGAGSQTITVTVKKKKTADQTITKSYTSTAGSGGTATINLAEKLPPDRGATSYDLSQKYADYITSAAVSQDGSLTFVVGTNGSVGDTTNLVVTATTDNYEDITITVKIKLMDKLTPVQKAGHEVAVSGSRILVYGQKLSSLTLDAVFVEDGTDKEVKGTLAWTDGNATPDAGTATAEWTFTPDNTDQYVTVTGTAAVQVNKAEGTVANKEGAEGYQTVYTFTGAEVQEPVSANFTTNSGIEEFTYTWYKDSVAEGNRLAGRPSAAGSYILKVDAEGTPNYTAASINLNVTVGTFTADAAAALGAANAGTDGWYHGDVTVTAPDGYSIAATQAGSYSGSLTVSADQNGAYTYYLKQDTTGYITEAMDITVKRDTVQPTAKITVKEKWWQSFLETISLGLYTNTEDTVTIKAEDTAGTANSGISTVEYYISGTVYEGEAGLASLKALGEGVWNTYNSGSGPKVSQNTVNYVYARVTDKAGNVSYVSTDGIVYDTTLPTLTLTPEGTAYIGADRTENTYTGTVEVAITAADAAVTGQNTLDTIQYVLDNGAKTTIAAGSRLQITGRGSHSLSVTATDKAGNQNTQTLTVRIYGGAPAVTLTPASPIVYDGAAIAEGTDFTLDKGGSAGAVAYFHKEQGVGDDTYVPGLPANAGNYIIRAVVAEDRAGFYPQAENTASLTIEQAQPTVTFNASVNRTDGIAIRLTAAVGVAGNEAVPTGEVTFYDTTTGSDVLIAAIPLTSGTAEYSYTGLGTQVYKLKAVYAGDANHKTVVSAERSVDTGKAYAVTVINGTAAVNGVAASTALEGQTITVTASSRPGYTFQNWSSNAGGTFVNEKAETTTFTMPGSAVTLTANYTQNSSGGSGGDDDDDSGSGSGGGQETDSGGGGNTAPAAPATDTNTNPGTGATTTPATPVTGNTATPGSQTKPGNGNTATPGSRTKPGTGNTATPGSQTKPGNGNTAKPGNSDTQEAATDTEKPFIKGEDGKTGWDVIRAGEEKEAEGSVINVDMNGATVVPGDIFDRLRGRDITITFDMDNGIIWSVDGKSITTDQAGDIDFSVKAGTDAIPVDILGNVTGESYSIQISLAHEGEFGFTAVLSINLGRENAGYTASLYYYNQSTGELAFICADEVAGDGTAELAFTHASDYVIAIDGEESAAEEPTQTENPDEDSSAAAEKTPETTQAWRPWWIVVAGILVIVVGIGVFFVVKRKKENE